MPNYARRVDANQGEIVNAFRKLGCSVKLAHTVGQGWPDLAVGYGGLTAFVEVKAEKGQLNARQKEWLEDWTGGHYVARDFDDVQRISSMLRKWHRAIAEASMTNKSTDKDGVS